MPTKPAPNRLRSRVPVKIQASATRRLPAKAVAEPMSHYDEDDFEPSMKLSRAFVIVLVMHVVAVGGIFAFNAIKTRQLSENRTSGPTVITPGGAGDVKPVALQAPIPAPIPASRRHLVKAGDNPYKLAQSYGVSLEDLLTVNYMKESSTIVVGQELKIPDGPNGPAPQPAIVSSNNPERPAVNVSAAVRPKPPQPSAPVGASPLDSELNSLLGVSAPPKPPSHEGLQKSAPSSSGKTYTVAKGDNPYNIAKKLGVEYGELLRVNGIDDPKKLKIGQQLKVPAKN